MNQQIPFEVGEALRYFRAAPDDPRAVDLVDRAYGLLRPELQPRYTARRIACRTEGQGTMADCVVLDGGIVFHSKALARYVGGSRELFLFGATLGSRIDSTLRRMAVRSVSEAAAGQAVAAALIESYCNACCRELARELPQGQKLKGRFSPGYGDWDLAEQRLLFRALDCARTIGLTLTDRCMMAPVKSVTAVVAIAGAADPLVDPEEAERLVAAAEAQHSKCQDCDKTDCEFRRT
ncbi:MAG TPA: Vitamin B12 dependent methionine synthase activation subunit [Acidaminococcaceae bacterium]|nr:Vitamin B12 dependent methionine synthase activation subunit [Acidaminococcaceae bacterium]